MKSETKLNLSSWIVFPPSAFGWFLGIALFFLFPFSNSAFPNPSPQKTSSPASESTLSEDDPLKPLESESALAPEGQTEKEFKLDLADCVRMAVRNNAEIRGAEYDLEESKWKLKEAQPRGVPVITYEYETAPAPKDASRAVESFFEGEITMVHRVKVGLGVPVTTFGKLGLAQSLAKGGIEASLEKKKQKTGEVVLKVKQLYYGILLGRELEQMLTDAEKKLGEEIQKREAGSANADPIELTKLKLTRYEILKRLGEVQRKKELAWQGLRLQIGIDRRVPFQILDKKLQPIAFELRDFQYYLEEAKRFRPESRLLNIALKAREDEYRLEKRKYLPNLGVGGFFEFGKTLSPVRNVGATNDFNDPFNFTRAGVGLRLKGELNWKETHSRVRQKEAQYYKMSLTKDYAEEGLELDLKDAYLNVQQAKTDLENAEKAYKLSRQLVFMAKTNYDVGVGDKKDYADSLQAYLLMKGRYLETIFNYNVAVGSLLNKLGYQPPLE